MLKRNEKHALTRSFFLVAALAVALPCAAGPFEGFRRLFTKEHGADSLIVTGNYIRPRLLAELVQKRTLDPILIVANGGQSRFFYISPKKERPMEVGAGSYVEFIELLNPRRVVILGNHNVVPRSITDVLQDRFPSVMITGTNWGVNAAAAANLFEYSQLRKRYSKYFGAGASNQARTDAGASAAEEPTSPPTFKPID